MNILFVGNNPEAADKMQLAARLCWPEAILYLTEEATKAHTLVEVRWPDAVVFHPESDSGSVPGYVAELRATSVVPIIVLDSLSDGSQETENGRGDKHELAVLAAGADDYIRRSASVSDLAASLVAVIRRVPIVESFRDGTVVSMNPIVLDLATHQVTSLGRSLSLTSTEFRLLHMFLKNPSRVLTHQFMAEWLWQGGGDRAAVIENNVQRLQSKLGDSGLDTGCIADVDGQAYRFLGPARASAEAQTGKSALAAAN